MCLEYDVNCWYVLIDSVSFDCALHQLNLPHSQLVTDFYLALELISAEAVGCWND